MRLTLRPATVDDATTLTDIYLSAFSKDAISLLCFPRNNSAVYKFWYDMIHEEISDPNTRFLCVVDEDTSAHSKSGNPEVVAFGKWCTPATPVSNTLPAWPEGSDAALANYFFSNLISRHATIMKDRKHWYLELLATRPEYQGKGAGSKLLRYGLEKADEDALEVYIEASPDGKPIYEHFGFKEVDRLVVQLEGKSELGEDEFVEVMMVRPVSGQ